MLKNKGDILIVGAGSTGLSSALFLHEIGFSPRIIDKRAERAAVSKALGVNSNTLKLLEQTEVTQRFLDNGWKCFCFNFWSQNKLIYKNDFSTVKHRYPFMLVQSQYDTESILEEAIVNRGIDVERGLTVQSIGFNKGGTEVIIDKGGEVTTFNVGNFILGCDGHNSNVRKSIGITFNGWEHDEEFKMYDIELETSITHKEGHYRFFKEGAMLMLHIRDGVWRVGGNMKDILNYLPKGSKTGKIHWETTFTIRERVAERFNVGSVYLLGDAAHIHSPVGGKGMNLCIEDSYIFSKLLKEGCEKEFDHIRRRKISRSVGILGQITDKVGGQNIFGNTIRQNMDKLSIFFPIVMPQLKKFLLGIK